MQEEINQLNKKIKLLEDSLQQFKEEYFKYNFPSSQTFKKDVRFEGLVGFFGASPVSRQPAITTPSGGGGGAGDAVDVSARTAIGQIKTALQNIGITL